MVKKYSSTVLTTLKEILKFIYEVQTSVSDKNIPTYLNMFLSKILSLWSSASLSFLVCLLKNANENQQLI